MELIIYRHARPKVRGSEFIRGSEFSDWLKVYELSDVEPFDWCGPLYPKVYCSVLERSRATGEQIGNVVIENSILNEAELPKIVFPRFRLSANIWVVVARILWRLGFSKECEPYGRFIKRVDEIVDWVDRFDEDESIVIVAHGWLNRTLIKRLSRKWRVVESTGHGYLGCTTLRLKDESPA